MLRLVMRRLGFSLATLWIVSVLMFVGTEILPGDAAQIKLKRAATGVTLANLRRELGLQKPAVERYFIWLGNMAKADLGKSLAGGATIERLIEDRLGNTLFLAWVVALVSIPLSIGLGLLAAMFPTSGFDRAITVSTLAVSAVPEFFIATVLVSIFAVQLNWFPAVTRMDPNATPWDMFKALALPVATLTFSVMSQMTRMTRGAVLNVMASPYIEMAILKGVPRMRIIMLHAFPNAIGPIVNIVAANLAYLVSGVVIVEAVFAFPGLGKLMIDGVYTRDMPLVQACGMMFCGIYVLVFMISDIISIVSNPRLRHPK